MTTDYIQNNIITILGIQTLPLKERGEIVEKATDLLQWRIIRHILTRLDEASQREFAKLIERDALESEINALISARTPDIDRIVDEQIAVYKKELSGLANDIDQKIAMQ